MKPRKKLTDREESDAPAPSDPHAIEPALTRRGLLSAGLGLAATACRPESPQKTRVVSFGLC